MNCFWILVFTTLYVILFNLQKFFSLLNLCVKHLLEGPEVPVHIIFTQADQKLAEKQAALSTESGRRPLSVSLIKDANQSLPFPLWLITASVNRQNAVCWLWARLKGCFSSSALWRTSGSTTWIWRKPTRNKGPTGGWNTPCRRLSDWLTCGRPACCGWDAASCSRAPPASPNTSATSWSATTAASSARATARWTRCVPSSTWTGRPTPSASPLLGSGGCDEPLTSVFYFIFFNHPVLEKWMLRIAAAPCLNFLSLFWNRYFVVSHIFMIAHSALVNEPEILFQNHANVDICFN